MKAFAEGAAQVEGCAQLPGARNGRGGNERARTLFGGVENPREGDICIPRRIREQVLAGGWDRLFGACNPRSSFSICF